MKKIKLNKEEVLKVVNHIIKTEMVNKDDFIPLKKGGDLIQNTGIDSFDFIMIYMNIGEIYGVDQTLFETGLTKENVTFKDLYSFLKKHATKQESYEGVKEKYIKAVSSKDKKKNKQKNKKGEKKKNKKGEKKKNKKGEKNEG